MYRLPSEFNLSGLIGQQLNQLCIGPSDLQLNFERGWTIKCEGKVSSTIDSSQEVWFHGEWYTTGSISSIVGKTVTTWKRKSDFEFELEFTGSTKLTFETEESPYESFTIESPNGILWIL